ncbi:MAG: hypothetical protein CM1200mP41_00260 [Gammaproteobacteria bacterium]|nr:MAG: hypothetical protein CM1200mP41_00260 [Gammaproteobacteria bacterium]
MAETKPFVAKAEFQEALGFPGELVDNWQSVALDKMSELLGKYRALPVFLDACVKCGACTDKCHYYLGRVIRKICRSHDRISCAMYIVAISLSPVVIFQASWCPGPDGVRAGRLVPLLPSMLRVPPLFCVLSFWN